MHPMQQRLDDLGAHLATGQDVTALIGSGSAADASFDLPTAS